MNQPSGFADFKLEQNPKLGFYTVGDQIFYSKPQALIAATNTGHFPHWNFNNEVYEKQVWTQEPETDLRELYKIRAQQIRDRYDYIRMEVSGGGDSSTALYAFLLNNIHLDEIVFRYPKTGDRHVSNNADNYKPENTLSEWEFAAQPMLKWVAVNYPNVKITIHDYSVNMLDGHHDETWVFRSKDYFQPGHCFKHDALGVEDHKHLAETGKSICVLYGTDKPKMCIRDNKWYLYFMDIQANQSVGTIGDYTNIVNEYFFWTPDLPEISIKQAHIIKTWFNMPQNMHLQFLVNWPNHSFAHRTTYEHIIKPLIYQDYDPVTFQTSKPTNSFYNEMDYWFYTNFKDTGAYTTWQAGLQLLTNTIDNKFFNKEAGRPVGFVGFLSPFYYIADAVASDPARKKFGLEIADRF